MIHVGHSDMFLRLVVKHKLLGDNMGFREGDDTCFCLSSTSRGV